MTDIIRNLPCDKAPGPDGISDRWVRKKRNGEELMEFVTRWIEGKEETPNECNEANMFLLSKEDTTTPPINRIRPLCAYSAIRKSMESALDRLDSKQQWSMINQN